MTGETSGDFGRVIVPPPTVWEALGRFYVPVRREIAGLYGSRLRVSIPEPDGEIMLTVLDHEGHAVTDIYVDHDALTDAISQVLTAYARIPETAKQQPTRPPNPMDPVEGSHP